MNSISKISKQNAEGAVEWTAEIVPYKLFSQDEEHVVKLNADTIAQNAYLLTIRASQNNNILDPAQSLSITANVQCGLIYQIDAAGKPHWMWVVL